MVTRLGFLLAAVLVCAACGDDDGMTAGPDADPGLTIDADPATVIDADPATVIDAGPGDPADATPGVFPEPIYIGDIRNGAYAVHPVTRDVIIATYDKFADEDPDNFEIDTGVIYGDGSPSHLIALGMPDSVIVDPENGHLMLTIISFFDLAGGGAPIFNHQPFLYDVETDTFGRIADGPGGTVDDWGGIYSQIAGDGNSVFFALWAAPGGMGYDVNFVYKQLLTGSPAQPGQSLAPIAPGLTVYAWPISYDGRLTAYFTYESLLPGDTDADQDLYIYDTVGQSFMLPYPDGIVDGAYAAFGGTGATGYRFVFTDQTEGSASYGHVVVCEDLLSPTPDCRPALQLCAPGIFCGAKYSISPSGRWLAVETANAYDAQQDVGSLLDIYRLDLDALFNNAPHPPVMLSVTPPDYTSPVSTRFNAVNAKMNDDGSAFFMDVFGGVGLGIWLSPAY